MKALRVLFLRWVLAQLPKSRTSPLTPPRDPLPRDPLPRPTTPTPSPPVEPDDVTSLPEPDVTPYATARPNLRLIRRTDP